MTLASTPQIDEAFKWTQDNENVQKKAQTKSRGFIEKITPLKKKIASTLLESFLFYSGFYLPLNWAAHSKLTNTADTIRLILRDEKCPRVLYWLQVPKRVRKSFSKGTILLQGAHLSASRRAFCKRGSIYEKHL